MHIEDPQFRSLLSDSTSRIQLWEKVMRATHVKTMAEVGVWKGEFAQNLLEQCEFIERYYMIDPWAHLPDWNKPWNMTTEEFMAVYDEAMLRTDFASSRRVVLRGRTKEVIQGIPDQSLDFAYIDGDHTLRGITIDLLTLLPKVKENGLIGGDDFINDRPHHDVQFEPTLVCPFSIYFAEAMDLPMLALPFDQFLIQKRTGASFTFTDLTGHYGDISLGRKLAGGK